MKTFKFYLVAVVLLIPSIVVSSDLDEQIKTFVVTHHEAKLPNPFSKQTVTHKDRSSSLNQENKLYIDAIIGEKACINGQWVTSGEKYRSYHIKNITPTSIMMVNLTTKKNQTLTFTKGLR